MPIQVKVCGITTLDDALLATEAGADTIGFVFHRHSPRFVEPEAVRRIIARLPPFVMTVGVFVNEEMSRVREIMSQCGLAVAQLHGDETAAYCEALRRPVLKAIRLRGREDFLAMAEFSGRAHVRGFVVDAVSEAAFGGTGLRADWQLAAEAAKVGPVLLAGGLTADNVGEAIRTVRPYGVDVSSGVEAVPGRKDSAKVRAFIGSAKLASEEPGVYTPSNS
jgi:phosphoribosylanthranilate isomerase